MTNLGLAAPRRFPDFCTMENQEKRDRLVRATISFLEDTTLTPGAYERHLLDRFITGELTIYQVLEILAMQDEPSEGSS